MMYFQNTRVVYSPPGRRRQDIHNIISVIYWILQQTFRTFVPPLRSPRFRSSPWGRRNKKKSAIGPWQNVFVDNSRNQISVQRWLIGLGFICICMFFSLSPTRLFVRFVHDFAYSRLNKINFFLHIFAYFEHNAYNCIFIDFKVFYFFFNLNF